ncbi:putative group 1 glycosyl transferase [Magnetofaba australis IT-1]|uniref:Putative group 1 glycosyl transferase n=1 Tax=Magnetofaba australis IT-1 TaxID=1434232 RepID=A0A1Y2K4E9_9PROT|nr:putative group 1 glycosyl transferase [Magnetofaba australis IT-1]
MHTEASEGWGGQEIRILTESRGLMARGHRLHLLCSPQSRIYSEAQAAGVPVTAMPLSKKKWPGLKAMRDWLTLNQPDVIITHSSTDSWLTAAARVTLGRDIPVIRLRHISAPVTDNFGTRWLYLRASRAVVTTGEMIRQQMIDLNRYPGERIHSIPTGVDLDRFTPGDRDAARAEIGLDPAHQIIGIVASLRSWKGHETLLEAFAGLREHFPVARVVIVGDGLARISVEAAIDRLQLHEWVTLAGDQRDVVPWLRAMDVFVLPSYANEGVPQALRQAMGCGVCAVGSAMGGIPETIEDGVSGLLFAPKNHVALGAALADLLENPDKRARLAEAGLARARERFGMEPMLDRMEALIRQVM